MSEEKKKIKCLVADTAALIKGARLDNQAEKIYTIREVIDEVRDRRARQALQILPYDLIFKEPSAESIKAVRDFARKTGDLMSLSAVDIKVMALAHTLEDEMNNGVAHLNTEPKSSQPNIKGGRALFRDNPVAHGVALKQPREDMPFRDFAVSPILPFSVGNFFNTSSRDDYYKAMDIKDAPVYEEEADEGVVVPNEVVEVDSDEEGWITPSNIHEQGPHFDTFGDTLINQEELTIACLTTDFAMQNVLIQMGINVTSLDGMLIKRAKTFVFECYACTKIIHQMDKQFCPHCGHNTLRKVAASVDETGTTLYYTKRTQQVNLRGTKYSIPTYQGGRKANNIIVRADQKEYLRQHKHQKRQASKVDMLNATGDDGISSNTPFVNRSSHKPIIGHGRRNPNEVRHTGNRKKKKNRNLN